MFMIFCLGVSLFLVPHLCAELTLRQFTSGLLDYPLPPQTERLSYESRVTPPEEHAMGCYFRVSMLLRSHLNQEEMRANYQNASVPPAGQNSPRMADFVSGGIPMEVAFAEDGMVTVSVWDGPYTSKGYQGSIHCYH
jgi:hypothetical protein